MADLEKAAAAKAKGNECLKAKNFEEAITHYTEAISHNPADKVFYSNRCAAYQSLSKFDEALADGEKCVEVDPSWPKSYLRKGASLLFLKREAEAVACYDAGLEKLPDNADLAAAKAKAEAAVPQKNPIADMFNNPNMMGNLMSNPQTSAFMAQPDFVQKIQQIQANPQMLNMHLSDPRISAALGVMLGVNIQTPGPGGEVNMSPGGASSGGGTVEEGSDEDDAEEVQARSKAPEPKELTEEEKAALEAKQARAAALKAAAAEKAEAVGHYKAAGAAKKKKDLDGHKSELEQAMIHFTKASELAPLEMSFLSNRAAVMFELGQFDECVAECVKAVEVGRGNQADFSQIAKAFARAGNAKVAAGCHDEGYEFYEKSLLEDHDRKVEDKLRAAKKSKREADKLAFLNPEKSEEAKAKGNEFFKQGQWADAVKAYSEALERNPENFKVYSNRAGALAKLMQFGPALEDIEKGIKLDPTFVKFYTRRGNIEFYQKEYHKCIDTFQAVIDMAPGTTEATEAQKMLQQTQYAIRAQQSGPVDKAQQARAMNDPVIQGIMADPMVRNVLEQFQNDPPAAQAALKDPGMMAKINKLISAGIIKTG